jgi:hypothetical protein
VRAIRLSDGFLDKVDHWATQQEDQPGRSETIRRLVELGLVSGRKPVRSSAKNAGKAKELAAETIDRLEDAAAPAEQRASRKRSLLKGPEEFREVRVDPAIKK